MEIIIVKLLSVSVVRVLSLLTYTRSPFSLYFSHKQVIASTKTLVNEMLFQTSELMAVCWQNSALTSYKRRLLPGFFA